MAIDEILIPEGTVTFGWNLGENVIEVETLNKIINVYYVSPSTKAYELVELDTNKETVTTILMEKREKKAKAFSEKPPQDFAAVVQAVYSEITAGGAYNKYDKAWGAAKHEKITSALTMALEIVTKGKTESDRISFDPRSDLKISGLELESGTLSRDQKNYFSKLNPKSLPTANGEVMVERELSINVRADGYLDLILVHKLNGEIRWESKACTPNDKTAVTKVLQNYYASETHTVGSWVLNI